MALNIGLYILPYNNFGFNIKEKSNIVLAASGNSEMNMSTTNDDDSKADMNKSDNEMDMNKSNDEMDMNKDKIEEGQNDSGHDEDSNNNSGPNMIFLSVLGIIIVLSIFSAAVIKSKKRGVLNNGTSN